MPFALLCLLALSTIWAAAPLAQGWTDAKPVAPVEQPPETPAEDPVDDATAAGAGEQDVALEPAGDADEGGAEDASAEIRRTRPPTTAAELDWVEKQLATDPFLQPFTPIGRAPGVSEFYDPFSRLQLRDTWIPSHAANYLIQGTGGVVLGRLSLRITREQSPSYGPVFRITQATSLGQGEQVDVWVSAVSGRPLRVLRSRDLGGARAGEQGVVVKNIERFDAKYLFDRVTVTKTAGGVTLAAPTRLQYACFDVAQLPLLMQLLDYSSGDWPFEALLFDSTSLETPTLQVNRPVTRDVLSAEPVTRRCWEIPVRWGNQQQTWYVERSLPRRLVKFTFSGMTFTLQDYAELSK